ncbi:hypothetical protein [Cupriavidus necator]|uniref:Lipoprotein n=1 Tax=Cupriavidus pinatubonensis (strain JMP 134 / LMG 1197) TaxID=264198 RepID=Q46MF6_CUPPJ|nr:hypothetical protein [Cupriavidus necator]
MRRRTLTTVASLMLVGACGGNDNTGGSATTTISPQDVSVPLQTAVANEANSGMSINFAISGTVDNVPVSGSGTLTDTPAVATTLKGVPVLETTETVTDTIVQNGTSAQASETMKIFRDPNTFAEVSEDRGGPVVDFPPYTIPASVKPGDGGVLVIGKLSSDDSRTTQIGTVQIAFSVAANTSDSVLVTFSETDLDNNNVQTAEDDRTFEVDSKGKPKHVKDKVKGKHNGHQEDVEEDDD